jgi:hypothetical protein
MRPISGGTRVRLNEDGTHFIDVLKMLFNHRLVTTPVEHQDGYDRGWCYYGFGEDEEGRPRTMETARAKAILAAYKWNGSEDTEPEGYDKRAV